MCTCIVINGYSRVTLGVSGLASVLCWLFFFLWSYVEPRLAPPFRLSIAPVQRAPVSPSHPSCGLFAYLKVAYHKVASLRVAPLRSLILLNLLVFGSQHGSSPDSSPPMSTRDTRVSHCLSRGSLLDAASCCIVNPRTQPLHLHPRQRCIHSSSDGSSAPLILYR